MLKRLLFIPVFPLSLFLGVASASDLSDAIALSTVQTVLGTGSKIIERNHGITPDNQANNLSINNNPSVNNSDNSQKEDFANLN
ncbi:hypothetical protein [Piscirickettsia litoralis]|uniref:Transporter n=1 Tax=Piscirickettsia litoralis TaxID=1891921 RepID=A0ABX3ABW3_9GAMM|nr:hypothetical protein [Piscirickettsia litoralis]ODN43619.1 hypothetical protein BGC07_12760 [Piscirickettsia litoralis]